MTGELAFLELGVMSTDNSVQETPQNHSFLAQTFTDSGGHTLPYRLLVPTVRPAHTKAGMPNVVPHLMPLVLLLHGSGERGNDNSGQLRNGVAELLGSATAAARFPCFYLVPQCPTQHRWVEVNWDADHHVLPPRLSMPLSATVQLVESLLGRHPIDPQRLYLIGLSMGGFGVWDLLSRRPECFAAAVSICGGTDDNAALAARAVPIWVFHGARDPIVPVERSRRTVTALRAAGGTPRYTEYPHVGHDAWTHAFAEPNLLPWLFAQRAAQPPQHATQSKQSGPGARGGEPR
jgi:predicted peptidase